MCWGMRQEIKMALFDSLAVTITTCFVCICALEVWIDDKTRSQSLSDSLLVTTRLILH